MTTSLGDDVTVAPADPVRVAVITNGDPLDVRNWSGTPFNAVRAIQARFASTSVIRSWILDRALPAINKVPRRFGWDLMREPIVARAFAWSLRRDLARIAPDVIVSIGATHKLAKVETDIPIVHVSDALFATITSAYSRYERLSRRSIKLGNRMQQSLVDRCGAILLTSHWAKDKAEHDYRVPNSLIRVAPLGANINDPGTAVLEVAKAGPALLFIGTDWESKGGDKVVETFRALVKTVPTACLHIVGAQPETEVSDAGVIVHGFLRKSDADERARLEDLFRQAAFFISMTEQEAFGLVFCEAAAFGLPVISRSVGGVPTIVLDGESGLLFDISTAPDLIASRIAALWADRAAYEAMRRRARREFEERLNWDAWATVLQTEIRRVVLDRSQGRAPER